MRKGNTEDFGYFIKFLHSRVKNVLLASRSCRAVLLTGNARGEIKITVPKVVIKFEQ